MGAGSPMTTFRVSLSRNQIVSMLGLTPRKIVSMLGLTPRINDPKD